MTPSELQARLIAVGVPCRVQRREVLVETCRFCGNPRWNLELNAERGLFHCWACDSGGRLDRLLLAWLGEEFDIPVRYDKDEGGRKWQESTGEQIIGRAAYEFASSARYLERRGVDEQTAQRYGLMVCTEEHHPLYRRLVIPLQDYWTGVQVGFIGRSYTGLYPKYLSTLKSRDVVIGHRVQSAKTPCLLVEGNFDGIQAHAAGYNTAVLGGVSAPWLRLFASRLRGPLVIMLDGEAQEEARRLYWSILTVCMERRDYIHKIDLPKGLDPASLCHGVLRRVVEKTMRDMEGATAGIV